MCTVQAKSKLTGDVSADDGPAGRRAVKRPRDGDDREGKISEKDEVPKSLTTDRASAALYLSNCMPSVNFPAT